MPTLFSAPRTSNKFEKSFEGLNIARSLRIIVRPLEKAVAGPGNPLLSGAPMAP
jgi:hypothetical protein